jgi:hypothetical protein
MAHALRHRVCLYWLAHIHLRCCTGSDRPGRTLLESKAWSAPMPSLNLKIRLIGNCGGLREVLFPYLPVMVRRKDFGSPALAVGPAAPRW